MKRNDWVLVMAMSMLSLTASAKATDGKVSSNFGLGYHVVQHQNDYGFGLNISSPLIIKQMFAFRLKSSILFNQNVIKGNSERMPYSAHSLSLVMIGGHVNPKIRLYGEGGLMAILPSPQFSSETFVPGAFGIFGFEFFFTERANYYIEIGGMGTTDKGRADKVANQPIYSNGLYLSAGLRVFLKDKGV